MIPDRADKPPIVPIAALIHQIGGLTSHGEARFAPKTQPKVGTSRCPGDFQLVESLLLKELRLFEKYGVDPDILYVSDTNKILAELIGGGADMCAGSGFNGLFLALERGAQVKILAGASISSPNIMYSNRPDIISVKDLPGKMVGTGAPGSLLYELAVGVMNKYGVDYRTVRFVNIGSSGDVFKALVGGSIDAGVAPIEFRESSGKYNIHPLVDGEFWKELPLYPNQAMYASEKSIADNRGGIVGVLAAYAELFRWIVDDANKPTFLEYYSKAIPHSTEKEAAFLRDFVSKPGALATGLTLSPDQIKYVQDLNVELGIQKTVLPFDRCADMSLAHEALKLARS